MNNEERDKLLIGMEKDIGFIKDGMDEGKKKFEKMDIRLRVQEKAVTILKTQRAFIPWVAGGIGGILVWLTDFMVKFWRGD